MPLATGGDLCCCCSPQRLLCRELIDEGVPAVKAFEGKQLIGAICGQRCTINTTNMTRMKKFCHDHNIVTLLPNGKDISIRDSCKQSPNLKSCRPKASMQQVQHAVQWMQHTVRPCLNQPCPLRHSTLRRAAYFGISLRPEVCRAL